MKKPHTLLLICALLAGTVAAHAASPSGPPAGGDAKKDMAAKASVDMAQGEVRKVDTDNKKITLKHGEIKNLDMPPMTMVFQVKDEALLGRVKVGDKVRFTAEKSGNAMVVTDLQPAP